jgi:hypothetical protein
MPMCVLEGAINNAMRVEVQHGDRFRIPAFPYAVPSYHLPTLRTLIIILPLPWILIDAPNFCYSPLYYLLFAAL